VTGGFFVVDGASSMRNIFRDEWKGVKSQRCEAYGATNESRKIVTKSDALEIVH
jgi:hypothetical protein